MYKILISIFALMLMTGLQAQSLDVIAVEPVEVIPDCKCPFTGPEDGDTITVGGKKGIVSNATWLVKCPPRSASCRSRECKLKYEFKSLDGTLTSTRIKRKKCVIPPRNSDAARSLNNLDLDGDIANNSTGDEMWISPNPVSRGDNFECLINIPEATQANISIRDAQGKLVLEQALDLAKGNTQRLRYSSKQLSAGIYFFTLKTNAAVLSKSILVK